MRYIFGSFVVLILIHFVDELNEIKLNVRKNNIILQSTVKKTDFHYNYQTELDDVNTLNQTTKGKDNAKTKED